MLLLLNKKDMKLNQSDKKNEEEKNIKIKMSERDEARS
jgi:hypothetical protein